MCWVKKGHFFHHYVAVALGALVRTKPEGYDLFCIKILEDYFISELSRGKLKSKQMSLAQEAIPCVISSNKHLLH